MIKKIKQLLEDHELIVIEANDTQWDMVYDWAASVRDPDTKCVGTPYFMFFTYEGIKVTILHFDEHLDLENRWLGVRPTAALVREDTKDSFVLQYMLNPLRGEVAIV